MIVREETREDSDTVHPVIEAAFGQKAEADLVASLHASGDAAIALVAEDAETIIGHILFSRLAMPAGGLALAPVSVLPPHQGKGVGSSLIRDGLSRARKDGWGAVFLLGEPRYYMRFGFRVNLAGPFDTPYPKDYVMALELTPGFLADADKTVRFAAPFDALS